MRCYLITTHSTPKFYKANGDVVSVDLMYVSEKITQTLNSDGELTREKHCSNSAMCGNIWMVESYEEAIKILAQAEIFPFESKVAAKNYAKQLGLQSFKYLQVT